MHTKILLLLLVIIGGFFHFYNLNWGAPFYFHPDERNIASSISQLSFPDQLNPHFFAYGSLPIYIIFVTELLTNVAATCVQSLESCIQGKSYETLQSIRFEDAIIIGRIYSSIFATALIPVLFVIGKKLRGNNTGLLAAFLATFSVGLIQFAHFATFEMWTTFFASLQLLVSIDFIKTGSKRLFYLLGLATGVLISIKVSNLALLAIPAVSLLIQKFPRSHTKPSMSSLFRWLGTVSILLLIVCIEATLIFLLTNPYSFLDFESFKGSILYESEVALGTLPVFYTGEFFNTTPIVFQLTKVFPFLLNPVVTFLFIPSFFYLAYRFLHVSIHHNKSMTQSRIPSILLLTSFLVLFLSQSFLFVKWIRYMLPTVPFIYLITAVITDRLTQDKTKAIRIGSQFVLGGLIISSVLFSVSYFVTAFVEKDTRLQARDFAIENIPPDAQILSEVYDLGITPFNDHFRTITLFNFYDLDSQGPEISKKFEEELTASDYIILPSQRILATRRENSEEFPKGYAFYNELQTNSNRFTKIYETPCSIFCQITYLGDPINRYEGTANVFDRPHLFLYEITD